MNHQYNIDGNCQCNNHKLINTIEGYIILFIMMILPVHAIVMNYFCYDYSWENINHIWITSVTFSFIITLMLLVYILFKKPYLAMVFGCHQKQRRSFKILNQPFVLCSRCSGIFVGIILSMFLTIQKINFAWYLIGIIPLLIDGLRQRFSKYQSNNVKRFATGVLFAPSFIAILSYYYLFIAKLMILGFKLLKFI